MFKTICLFAVTALAFSQDAATVASNAANSVINSIGSTTLDQVAQDATSAIDSAFASANIAALPTLNSVTIGWGSREVVATPQSANPTNDDWLNRGETINLEQVTGTAADGEWTLNWSVENGDDYAAWNNNGNIQLVDVTNGANNVVYTLSSNYGFDTEFATNFEQVVDAVYNSDATTLNTNDVAANINNVVSQVVASPSLQGFLSQNGQSTQSTVSSVVNTVISNPEQAVQAVQGALGPAE